MAAQHVQRFLTRLIGVGTDVAAFDPSDSHSLTFGAPTIPTTGNLDAAISDLFAAISNGTPSRPALVLGTGAARALIFANSQAFRDVALVGRGSIAGRPTFTTPAAALSAYAIAVDTDAIVAAMRGSTCLAPCTRACNWTTRRARVPSRVCGNRT